MKHILKKYYNIPTAWVLVLEMVNINIIVSSYLTIRPNVRMPIN